MIRAWIVQRILKGLNFFLLGLMVLVGTNTVRIWIHSEPLEIPTKKIVNESEFVKHPITEEEAPITFAKHIFEESSVVEESNIPIQFHGTASRDEVIFAVIEYQGKQSMVQEGQKVGTWIVQEILDHEIVLDDAQGKSFKISRDVIQTLPAMPAQEIKRNAMPLDRSLTNNLIENWADLFKDVRIFPYVQDGKTQGYVLLNVRPDSIVQKMGFRTGDIVEKINGCEVTRLESLLALRDHIDEGVTFDVKRGPKKIQLVYQAVKERG